MVKAALLAYCFILEILCTIWAMVLCMLCLYIFVYSHNINHRWSGVVTSPARGRHLNRQIEISLSPLFAPENEVFRETCRYGVVPV